MLIVFVAVSSHSPVFVSQPVVSSSSKFVSVSYLHKHTVWLIYSRLLLLSCLCLIASVVYIFVVASIISYFSQQKTNNIFGQLLEELLVGDEGLCLLCAKLWFDGSL